jgi:hypothetical protein
MRTIDHLDDVAELARRQPALYVRVSEGPEHDRSSSSTDHETGLALPGLSVNPLHPPRWWRDRPVAEWVARQLRAYEHLMDGDSVPWLLIGRIVDRGPDNEPLVEAVEPVAWLSSTVMKEAEALRPDDGGKPPWQS